MKLSGVFAISAILVAVSEARDEPDLRTTPPYNPHDPSQVDKLHRDGITGKGFKIAILSTGVSFCPPR